MSYSRRQLYAMGEPIGDSATYRKADGGLILGGGGSSSQPTSTSTTTSELPEWARGYAKDTLAKASQLTDINTNPYKTYGGQRNAELAPMQVTAMQDAAKMQPNAAVGTGMDMAKSAGMDALGTNYQFDQNAANQYMNPYMQNVVDIQKREAQRQSGIQGTQQQAQAVQAGAFGGSRDAIMRAERERNLGQQMGDIQATGSNAAFQNAQQQFNADQSRRLQGLQTGIQAAGQVGALGQNQFNQQMDINKMQAGYGGMQQAQLQKQLDTNYGDFQNQMNYPYKQLGFMSDMLRGSGAGTTSASTVYQAPGSTLGQLGGLGVTAMGLSKYLADGGQVKSYADGGAIEVGQDVDSESNLAAIIHKLPDQLLQQAAQAAAQRGDQEELKVIQDEMAMRASLHRGLASVVPSSMADMADEGMAAGANGGIVAFDEGGTTSRFSEFFKDSPEAIARRKLFEELKRRNEAMMKAERDRPGLFERTTPEKIASTEANAIKAGQEYLGASRSAPQTQTQSTTLPSTGTGSGRGTVNPETPSKREAAPEGSGGGGGGGGSKSDRPSSAISDLHPAIAASVDKALADMAANSGVSAGSFKSDFKNFHDMISKDNEGMLQTLKDQIAKGDQHIDETKGNSLGSILAAFGANWAANAAKPGATFLGSAAAAAPAANESMVSQDKILRDMNDAQNKMKADFTKFQISLSKDDQKTALQATQDMQRNAIATAQLAEQASFHRADIGIKGQELAIQADKLVNDAKYQMGMLGVHQGQAATQNRKLTFLEQDAATRAQTAKARLAGVQRNLASDYEKYYGNKLRDYEKKMGPLQAKQLYESEKQNYITSNMAPYISGGSDTTTSRYPSADSLLD